MQIAQSDFEKYPTTTALVIETGAGIVPATRLQLQLCLIPRIDPCVLVLKGSFPRDLGARLASPAVTDEADCGR